MSQCHGEDPTQVKYDQQAMRDHLFRALDMGELARFPILGQCSPDKPTISKYVKLYVSQQFKHPIVVQYHKASAQLSVDLVLAVIFCSFPQSDCHATIAKSVSDSKTQVH